ncbi:dihydroxyacetone kinase subunit DhaL [Nakamurella sp. PAMC28650]|jgi:dihydroxyacetone kinase-like protein|uniref:dihydroxyacetone kinase subunit DhaL n=1 Tax=Nakamurella sp. PAMC28650 TaxID=2762325 RepID=UPI00164DF412|nr:dihydroxyacetone kinase subunit DhaL [Nakamurella sp. PAMC28650]QNK80576.1 dihydroxyacetone kinase subunit L [Nakamurella sp. PAMC28650]
MGYDAESSVAAIRALGAEIARRRSELTHLDQEIGDGDHGENLARGFSAVLTKLRTVEPQTPAEVMSLVASTLISTVGGASGPLFGTAFLRASTVLGKATQLDGALVAAALVAARDGVVGRGKAELGDKTMVDALSPAADAATAAAQAGSDVAGVLAAAADAAAVGAAATTPLQARKGRASYLGERSIGHLDPGAQSTAYVLASLAASAAGHPAPAEG